MTTFIQGELYNISEVKLIYSSRAGSEHRPVISCSKEAHSLLRVNWDENRIELLEEFKILLLNRGNACIGISNIASGGIDGCFVDPRLIFATALKANTSSIIMAHNHPSGNSLPSQQDISLTKKLVDGGRMLGIHIADHIILTPTSYLSMGDQGLIL